MLPLEGLDYWDKKPDTGCPARHRRVWPFLRSRAGSLALGSQDGMALDQADEQLLHRASMRARPARSESAS